VCESTGPTNTNPSAKGELETFDSETTGTQTSVLVHNLVSFDDMQISSPPQTSASATILVLSAVEDDVGVLRVLRYVVPPSQVYKPMALLIRFPRFTIVPCLCQRPTTFHWISMLQLFSVRPGIQLHK